MVAPQQQAIFKPGLKTASSQRQEVLKDVHQCLSNIPLLSMCLEYHGEKEDSQDGFEREEASRARERDEGQAGLQRIKSRKLEQPMEVLSKAKDWRRHGRLEDCTGFLHPLYIVGDEDGEVMIWWRV